MAMIYLYKYFFYRVYKFIRNLDRAAPSTVAAHSTIMLITFLITVDLDSVLRIIEGSTSWNYKEAHFLVLIGVIYIINLLFFYKLFHYRSIELEFSNESRKARKISTLLTIILVVMATLPIFIK
jgi:uncharacterized membrane protein